MRMIGTYVMGMGPKTGYPMIANYWDYRSRQSIKFIINDEDTVLDLNTGEFIQYYSLFIKKCCVESVDLV